MRESFSVKTGFNAYVKNCMGPCQLAHSAQPDLVRIENFASSQLSGRGGGVGGCSVSHNSSRRGGSVVSVSDSRPGGCEFDPWLRRTFFTAYFRLSLLQKHSRKVVGGLGKKNCVGTGVRKPGNTCASPTAMI